MKKVSLLLLVPMLFLGSNAYAGGAPLPPPAPAPSPSPQGQILLSPAVLDAIGAVLAAMAQTFANESQEIAGEQAFINSAGLEISGMITTVATLRTMPMQTIEQRQAIAVQLQPIIQRITEISARLNAIIAANNQRRSIIQQMISVLIQLSNLISVAA